MRENCRQAGTGKKLTMGENKIFGVRLLPHHTKTNITSSSLSLSLSLLLFLLSEIFFTMPDDETTWDDPRDDWEQFWIWYK